MIKILIFSTRDQEEPRSGPACLAKCPISAAIRTFMIDDGDPRKLIVARNTIRVPKTFKGLRRELHRTTVLKARHLPILSVQLLRERPMRS
jgi:hypothetical protein